VVNLEHARRLFAEDDRSDDERERLLRLLELFAQLPPPPDPLRIYPRYGEYRDRFLTASEGADSDELEEAFLTLYAHVHGHEAPYTAGERRRVDETGGYWCHAGGLSPILKAGSHLGPDSVSADFGAGNGLQSLLMQKLDPHRKTIQIEISSRMVDAGRHLQSWLEIPEERVEWIVGDVLDHSPAGIDFLYLYRPVRPEGEGRRFYEHFAAELESSDRPVVIFSIADCLRGFLGDGFESFYHDGHLTCFRRRNDPSPR
jgi:hypothetical protein